MLTSTTTKVQFTGNGSTTVFSFDYLVSDSSHLKVYVTTRRR